MAGKGLPAGRRGGYRDDYISWTRPENLEPYATIIEMCVCSGMKPTKVARHLGLSHSHVNKIFRKYKPIQGDRDVTMTLMSKV